MEQHEKIRNAVTEFIKAGDDSDTEKLSGILHPDFKNTQHGFFENKGVVIFDKQEYIALVAAKTFGGNPRTLEIVQLDHVGSIAMVKALLKSSKLSFTSFISLVMGENNEWTVIGNFPHITTVS